MATLKNVTINDTGFVKLAAGTTAERPGSPTAGMIRYNTDLQRNELYDGAKWVTLDGENHATGGTVNSTGGYRIHTFTSGNSNFTMTYPGVVEILMVAGGGGGCGIGGGGGAGGFVYESQVQLPAATYTISVGTGGGGEPSHNSGASPGNPSSISGPGVPNNYIAYGGGRGISYTRGGFNMAVNGDGGSGGGGPGGHGPSAGGEGGFWPQAPTGHGASPNNHWHQGPMSSLPHPWGNSVGNGRDGISMEGNGYGSGVVGQGHPGGFGAHGGGFDWAAGNTVIHCGGGGGGAGSTGKPISNSNTIATGGAGLASQITGTVTRYAGGGGGGTHGPGNPGHYGLSGAFSPGPIATAFGGGRAGIHPGNPEPASPGGTGAANRGGGGGGGVHGSPNVAGSGGPGIVVIRYRDV